MVLTNNVRNYPSTTWIKKAGLAVQGLRGQGPGNGFPSPKKNTVATHQYNQKS